MKLYPTESPTIETNLNVILKHHVSISNFPARDETL